MKSDEPNVKANTPWHCWNCQQFAECTQAQNMMADTQAVPGFAYDADTYCEDCLGNDLAKAQSLGSNECDCPSHCADCGIPLDCNLTEEGIRYLKESIADGAGCCRELWPILFSEYLEEDEEEEA